MLLIETPKGFDEDWRWILKTILCNWLGVRYKRKSVEGIKNVYITSLKDSRCKSKIVLGAEFWLERTAGSKNFPNPTIPISSYEISGHDYDKVMPQKTLPVLFKGIGSNSIPIDIFGSCFWMLARLEEITFSCGDKYKRFLAKDSLAKRCGFLLRPIVDEYVVFLEILLNKNFPDIITKPSQFELILSHDVDAINQFGYGYFRPRIRGLLRELRKFNNVGLIKSGLKGFVMDPKIQDKADPFNTFNYLLKQSAKRNLKSIFFFAAGRTDIKRDPGYMLNHPVVCDLLKKIHDAGSIIGLHPSFNTYNNLSELEKEFKNLKKVCSSLSIHHHIWQSRMHYLRLSWPDTLKNLASIGINKDHTMAFADHIGFRCGTSRQYRAYDPIERKEINLDIQPLVMMECSLISSRYMNSAYSLASYDLIKTCKLVCRKLRTPFSLLWHNNHFNNPADKILFEYSLDC